jgi:hypothetical protein
LIFLTFLKLEFVVKSINRYLISIVFVLISPAVIAEWTKVADGNMFIPDQYIDMSSVKQAGPMAIYRQVNVLSQGTALLTEDLASKLSIYEYDCMNNTFRVLQSIGFSKAWATGDQVVLQSTSQNLREWHDLPLHPLGQGTFDILCPGGKVD